MHAGRNGGSEDVVQNQNDNNNNTQGDDDAIETTRTQLPEFVQLQEAAEAYKAKAKDLTEKEQCLEYFQLTHCITSSDFFEHGSKCVEDGFQYFLEKFSKPDGPYEAFMKMMRAAELFNPLQARLMSVGWMEARVEECRWFGFPEFLRRTMLDGMKRELRMYKGMLQELFDWDEVDGAATYNRSLDKKNQKNNTTKTWQEDPNECARRIWEWWVKKHDNFHFLSIAVRLVALVQTSSASAERMFSQLGIILDAVGTTSLDDHVEICLFERVDRKVYDSL
jgi:hypothetical protein